MNRMQLQMLKQLVDSAYYLAARSKDRDMREALPLFAEALVDAAVYSLREMGRPREEVQKHVEVRVRSMQDAYDERHRLDD